MDGMTRRSDSIWFRTLVALGILLAVVLASMATADESPADGAYHAMEVVEA